MPSGYLVTLGDGSLNNGDTISGSFVNFTADVNLGAGDWEWSGTWGGFTYTNEEEPGVFYLAENGNIYFVPDFGPVDTLTASSVLSVITTIVGTDTDDVALDGGTDDEAIYGLDGKDDIEGRGGADTITGGEGDDTIDGGAGDDVIYGDEAPTLTSQNETFSWDDAGFNNQEVAGQTLTQTTGQLEVSITITDDGALTSATIDETTDNYEEDGEGLSDSSSLYLIGGGGSDVATIRVDFAAAEAQQVVDAAQNVTFRINDFDSDEWIDEVTINAVGPGGSTVPVKITAENSGNIVTNNSATSGIDNTDAGAADGSLLVEIAGPVEYFEIVYTNGDDQTQWLWITDLNFDTVIPAGGDEIAGGTGADDMYGGAGDDIFYVADGDDAYGQDGDDTFILTDLGEANADITIDGGSGDETGGDTIQLGGLAYQADVSYDSDDPSSGTITLTDGTIVNFSNVENIVCFTPGTLIDTPHGRRPIETLRPGDVVLTRDHGPQVIRWAGARTVPAEGAFAPIQLSGAAIPGATAPLLVSPQHRMLFSGYRSELLFGESEVLVAAKHLVDGRDVRIIPHAAVTYIHIMFDAHEVITANGVPTESFYPGDQSLGALDDGSRHELLTLFPELKFSPSGPTARRALKAYEATLL
ncbi:MAG: Hint domain-containing protein [Pseudomonadota bacterium]